MNLQGDIGLTLNGGEEYIVSTESFTFPTEQPIGIPYDVTISCHPVGQLCNVTNTGTVDTESGLVREVTIECAPSTLTQTIHYNSNTDDEEDYAATRVYSANGALLHQTMDINADNIADRVESYTYDATGKRLTSNRDEGNDGTIKWIATYTYNTKGQLFTSLSQYSDAVTKDYFEAYYFIPGTNSAIPTERSLYLKAFSDFALTTQHWFYNENNALIIEDLYIEETLREIRFHYNFNEMGLLSELYLEDSEPSTDALGMLSDVKTHYFYDHEGRLLPTTTDLYYFFSDYTYEENNHLLSETYDDDADGSPEYTITYSYAGDLRIMVVDQ